MSLASSSIAGLLKPVLATFLFYAVGVTLDALLLNGNSVILDAIARLSVHATGIAFIPNPAALPPLAAAILGPMVDGFVATTILGGALYLTNIKIKQRNQDRQLLKRARSLEDDHKALPVQIDPPTIEGEYTEVSPTRKIWGTTQALIPR